MSSRSSSPIAAGSPSFVDKYLGWVPLLTPAVTANGYEIDRGLLGTRLRIMSIAWAIFAFPKVLHISKGNWSPVQTLLDKIINILPSNGYLKLTLGTITFLAIAILPVTLIWIYDKQKAQKIVDNNIVNAYSLPNNASEAVFRHVSSNLSAAQLLVERGGDLNKRDERGNGILSQHNVTIDVFKLLVDQGCDLVNRHGMFAQSAFMNAVMSDNPEYLRYLVNNHNRLIQSDNYTLIRANFSSVSWGVIKHREVVDLLLNLDLNINARDPGPDGRTPLGWLLHMDQESTGMPDIAQPPQLTRTELIALFREKGARE